MQKETCFFLHIRVKVTYLKLRNNADVAKRFWKINAGRHRNKGNSRKIGESPQGATKQIEADCGTD